MPHPGMGPLLTSLPRDDEVSCEVRPPRSPIRSLTSLHQVELQSPDEDCISHSATHPAKAEIDHVRCATDNKFINAIMDHMHCHKRSTGS